MTLQALQKLEVLRATKRYSSCVQKKLSKRGKKANSAMSHSAAKYYVALKKLAEK